MKKRVLYLMPVLILAGGFAVMMILLNMRSDVPRKTPEPRPKIVKTLIARPQTTLTTISGLGRVTSAQPVDLYSEVSGVLLAGVVPFRPAQSFRRGDLLLKVDDRQIRLDISSKKSEFLTALAVALAEIKSDSPDDYKRWRDYFDAVDFDEELAEMPSTDDPRIKLLLSRLNVYKLYYEIRDLEIMLEKHHFHAPFDGSIVSADMREGTTARGGSRLGQIINLEELEVELPVPGEDVRWVDRGSKVRLISSEAGPEWSGTVIRIGNAIDSRTQTIPVYVSIDVGGEDVPYEGTYVNAEIPGRPINNAVTIPRSAVYENRYVYLIQNGKLEYREINIARSQHDSVILAGGINLGDTVVVDLMQGVAPGMPAMSRDMMDEGQSK